MIQVIGITKKQASEILGRHRGMSHRELRTMLSRKGEAGLGQTEMTVEEANEAVRHICSPKTSGEERLYDLEKRMENRRRAAYAGIPGYSGMSIDERLEAQIKIDSGLAQEERELFGIDLDTLIDTLEDIEAQRTSPRAQAFFDAQARGSFDSAMAIITLNRHVQFLKSHEETDDSEEEVVEAISKLKVPMDFGSESVMDRSAKMLRLLLDLENLSPHSKVREAAGDKIEDFSKRIREYVYGGSG
jgi:hypothetical protein